MPVLSKPLTDEEKNSAHASVVNLGMMCVFTQNIALLSDTALITSSCGDVGEAASALALTSSLAGATEFLLNPVIGKMADQYGRKWIYYIGPAVSGVVMSLAVLATEGKNLKVLMVHRALCWSLLSMSGSFVSSVTLSDMFQGSELGIRLGQLFGSYGLPIITGAVFGDWVYRKTGNHMNVFRLRVLLALFQLFLAKNYVPETLTADRVLPFKMSQINPFSFLHLFTRSSTLRTLSLALFFHCFGEGKNIISLSQSWMTGSPLGWTSQKNSAWQTLFGVLAYVSGVKLLPVLIRKLGTRGFTSLTNWSNAVGLTVMGLPVPSYEMSFVIGTLLWFPGINNGSAQGMKAIGTDHAVANGFGRGQYGGMYSGLRNFSQFVAPLLFGAAYKRATASKSPGAFKQGLCWFLVALSGAIIPELLHRSLSDKDLEVPVTPVHTVEGKAS